MFFVNGIFVSISIILLSHRYKCSISSDYIEKFSTQNFD